jgi:hypothetical protein
MLPRLSGLAVTQVGPEVLATVTMLTGPPVAETVTIWLLVWPQLTVGLQVRGATVILPQQLVGETCIVPVTGMHEGVPQVLQTKTV